MKILIVLFLSIYLFDASAQVNQNVFYLKFDGSLVSTLDNADYIRYIQEPKEGERLFNLIETYKDGNKKRFSKIRFFEPYLVFAEGKVLSYFPNGKVESIESYGHSRRLLGDSYFYYPNGKIKELVNYKIKGDYNTYIKSVKLVADTSGVNLLNDKATGKITISDFDGSTSSGYYFKGKKEGKWTIDKMRKKIKHVEIYKNDILISGSLVDSLGNQSIYKYIKTKPSFTNKIIVDQYEAIQAEIDFDKRSLDKKKGLVVVNFDVSEKSVIENVNFLKMLSPANDKDALETIKSYIWIPATQYGKPVNYKNYILSIYYR